MNTPHFFGHVSSSEHRRGLFPVFYDVTEKVSVRVFQTPAAYGHFVLLVVIVYVCTYVCTYVRVSTISNWHIWIRPVPTYVAVM